jgi:hypothetical protein
MSYKNHCTDTSVWCAIPCGTTGTCPKEIEGVECVKADWNTGSGLTAVLRKSSAPSAQPVTFSW